MSGGRLSRDEVDKAYSEADPVEQDESDHVDPEGEDVPDQYSADNVQDMFSLAGFVSSSTSKQSQRKKKNESKLSESEKASMLADLQGLGLSSLRSQSTTEKEQLKEELKSTQSVTRVKFDPFAPRSDRSPRVRSKSPSNKKKSPRRYNDPAVKWDHYSFMSRKKPQEPRENSVTEEEKKGPVKPVPSEGLVELFNAIRLGLVADIRQRSLLREYEWDSFNERPVTKGLTPLQYAASLGKVSVGQYLLSQGADPDRRACKAYGGRTAPMIAFRRGHVEFVNMLIKDGRTDLGATDKEKNNIFHIAAMRGDVNMLQSLIDRGKHHSTHLVSSSSSSSSSSVAEAIKRDEIRIFWDCANVFGQTPLVLAAECGSVACVKLLIREGARLDVLVKSRDGAITQMSLLHVVTLASVNDFNVHADTKLNQVLEYLCKLHSFLRVSSMDKLGHQERNTLHEKGLDFLADSKFASVEYHKDGHDMNALEFGFRVAPTFATLNVMKCLRLVASTGCSVDLDCKESYVAFCRLFAYLPAQITPVASVKFTDFVKDAISDFTLAIDVRSKLNGMCFEARSEIIKWRCIISDAIAEGIRKRQMFTKIVLLLPQQDIDKPEFQQIPIVAHFYRNKLFDINVLKELLQYVW